MSTSCKVELECPYCGNKFKRVLSDGGMQTVGCPLDDGGCDKYFAVDLEVSVKPVIYRLEKAEAD